MRHVITFVAGAVFGTVFADHALSWEWWLTLVPYLMCCWAIGVAVEEAVRLRREIKMKEDRK